MKKNLYYLHFLSFSPNQVSDASNKTDAIFIQRPSASRWLSIETLMEEPCAFDLENEFHYRENSSLIALFVSIKKSFVESYSFHFVHPASMLTPEVI